MCDQAADPSVSPEPEAVSDEIAATLIASHREFLRFVERRVGDRALAEEILQDAFVRSVEKLESVEENAIGWFYRVLRNAIVDHHRRAAVAERRLEALASEPPTVGVGVDAAGGALDAELRAVVCSCVRELVDTLKPEYAEALRRIEIDGIPVKDYATEAGISPSNAGVRVFRAREALRKQVSRTCGTCAEHGCLDCTCSRGAHARG